MVVLVLVAARRPRRGRLGDLDRRLRAAARPLKPRDPGAQLARSSPPTARASGFIQSDDLRRPVAGQRDPEVLKDATVAIEDERFYKHKGVDYEGIIRAAVKNAQSSTRPCRAARR